MKLALFAASAAAVLAVTAGPASAQPVVVQQPQVVAVPSYAPGVAVGGVFGGRGFSVGGVYAPAPVVVAPAPVVVAGPTVVPVGGRYGYYPYGRPYYAPYGYPHHHHRRW